MEITEEITVLTSTLTAQDRWLNESLYELHRPQGLPKLQVLFFHGFQRDYENAHLTTWTSPDGSRPWPQTWLAEEFPEAHILSVSYFGGKLNRVDVDMYIVIENLISDLLQAKIGQEPRCPVVLVGHSFGGLVIKQLCVKAFDQLGPDSRTVQESRTVQLLNLVDNIKGIFFYATPHHGVQVKSITLLDPALLIPTGPLLDYVKSLSKDTARLNDSFDSLWKQHKEWRIRGLGESLPTKFETTWRTFEEFIVPEGSSRYSVEFNIAEGVDHFSVSHPESKISRSFTALESLLKDIADDPQLVVEDGHQETGLPHYPILLEKHAHDIKQRLIEESVLGISGMGGIGKTTLAKRVYNIISSDFEYTCFANEVKTVPRHNLDDWLRGKVHRYGTRMDGAKLQWSNLSGKKTLIVMDDIDSQDQLKHLPPLRDFGKGSCIILTSRDEDNFKFYPSHGLYKMDFLGQDEAKQLFCLHAFGIEDIPVESNHLSEHVKAVVRKCDGLPLTLEVMGRYLSDQIDAKTWKETIDQLSEAHSVGGEKEDRIWASLKVSYDALEKDQQAMFIDAGTCFLGRSLVLALSSTYKNPTIMWTNLVRRSMVKEGKHRTVWVHEQLRDLSWRFAKDDIFQWRSGNSDTFEEELSKRVCTNIKVLDVSDHGSKIPLNSFGELKELKYLRFHQVAHKGSGLKFPRTLSVLEWTPFRTRSLFPVDLTQMKNLTVLDLRDWYVSKRFPEAVCQLTNLRYLSLRNLRGLDRLPESLGKLSQLKWLEVRHESEKGLIRTSPESFGKLVALEHLELENVEVAELPESFGELSQLEHVELVRAKLVKLPESFGKLSSLKRLHIEDCLLEHLPNSFSRLSRLQQLTFEGCRSLLDLGNAFESLPALVSLRVEDCAIDRLPESLGELNQLRDLYIEGSRIKYLPKSFGKLSSLRTLHISCPVEELPIGLEMLSSLKSLNIEGSKLESLPDSLGMLSSLKSLNIEGSKLESLPDSLGMLSSLESLIIEGSKLESLPDSLGMLSSLESLDIVGSKLESLPDSLGMLSSLKRLRIWGKELERLPDSLGMLSSLESLDMVGIKLKSLPDSIGQLHSLRRLALWAPSLRRLPYSFQELSSSREIIFDGDGHECLPDDFDHLPLPSLSLTLDSANRLPEYLSGLEYLELINCDLEKLPEELGNLKPLQTLEIRDCRSLGSVLDSLGPLSSLRELRLENCNSLRFIPDSVGHISSLRELHLESLDNLKTLPHSLGRHSSSQLAPRQGERRNVEEVSFTTGGAKNTEELAVSVNRCPGLGESTMRSLGWVVERRGPWPGDVFYRRKLPANDNFPGVRVREIMSKVTAKLCFAPSY